MWELLDTPLMVDILIRSYQGLPMESLAMPRGVDERRRDLFGAYVDRMFLHRPGSWLPHGKVEHWLTWLAQQLSRHQEKDFYLENLQVDWLSEKTRWRQRWAVRLVISVVWGLVGGLGRGLANGLGDGLTYGLFWLVFYLVLGRTFPSLQEPIECVETMRWRVPRALTKGGLVGWISLRLGAGLAIGLVIGLVFVVGGLALGMRIGLVAPVMCLGLFLGLFVGLLTASFHTINDELAPGKVEQRLAPNQAIWASLRNGLICIAIGLGIFLVPGLVAWLVIGLDADPLGGMVAGLLLGGLGAGPVLGLLLGLNRGGGAFIRHFVLRAQLALEGFAPFRYVQFLEYATTLLFLERNGGAYRFRHDLLQEYFASLTATAEDASNSVEASALVGGTG